MDIQLAQTEAFEEPDSSAAGFPHLEELVFAAGTLDAEEGAAGLAFLLRPLLQICANLAKCC